MRLLLRKIAALIVAAGLALSGATSQVHANISPAGEGTASLHEAHQVQQYADLAIEAGDEDCLHATGDAPMQHQHDDSPCKKCCTACTSASLMPSAPLPILILSQKREAYAITRVALVAHAVPTDPGIPKPLN